MVDTLNPLKPLQEPCIFHSNQGSQYTEKVFQNLLKQESYLQSFSDAGFSAQNGCIKSFWSNFKGEQLYLRDLENTNTKKLITQYIYY